MGSISLFAAGSLDGSGGGDNGVTALRFEDEAGMLLATGNETGEVRLFDLRSSRPVIVKDHNSGTRPSSHSGGKVANRCILSPAVCSPLSGLFKWHTRGSRGGRRPVKARRATPTNGVTRFRSNLRDWGTRRSRAGVKLVDLKFHQVGGMGGDPLMISTDTRSCKVWHQHSGKTYTTLEPADGDINDICIWPGSGFMIMALETKRMGCFFVPSLGPAPRWCSFMENLTEELEEETQAAVYDDYHFVTKEELDKCALRLRPPSL
jgi:hypothetical protein